MAVRSARDRRLTAGGPARLAIVLLWNALLIAALLELGLRVYGAVSGNPLLASGSGATADLAADLERRLERRRGVVALGTPFNSLGFRDEEFETPKPGDVFRIVALADSFGVISNVAFEHLHLTRLEAELADLAPPRRVEVCNLGISAMGPLHYLAVLERYGLPLEPDLVVAYVFLGNDFKPAYVLDEAAAGGLREVEGTFDSPWDRLFLYRAVSRLSRIAAADVERLERSAPGAEPRPEIPPWAFDRSLERPTFPEAEFLRIELARARFFDPATSDAVFEAGLASLGRIRDLALRVTGRPLVVVLIPDELQVDGALRAELEERVGRRLDLEKPRRAVDAALGEGAILIDLLPALGRRHRESGRVYHLRNTHWNTEGNEIAAREVAVGLLEERGRLGLPVPSPRVEIAPPGRQASGIAGSDSE